MFKATKLTKPHFIVKAGWFQNPFYSSLPSPAVDQELNPVSIAGTFISQRKKFLFQFYGPEREVD